MAERIKYCQGSNDGGIHGNSIEERLLHFFGCLRFSDREKFFRSLEAEDKLRARVEEELARTAKLRKIFETEGLNTETGKLLQSFKATRATRFPKSSNRNQQEMPENAPASQGSTSNVKKLEDEIEEVVLGDLRANVIYFKKKPKGKHPGPYDHPELEDTFPNQRVPLSLLLADNPEKNPLMWKCEDDMIRYFHIPANNMSWVEVVLSALDLYAHSDLAQS